MKRILILALVLVGLTSCNNQNQVVSGVVVEYKGIKIEKLCEYQVERIVLKKQN